MPDPYSRLNLATIGESHGVGTGQQLSPEEPTAWRQRVRQAQRVSREFQERELQERMLRQVGKEQLVCQEQFLFPIEPIRRK